MSMQKVNRVYALCDKAVKVYGEVRAAVVDQFSECKTAKQFGELRAELLIDITPEAKKAHGARVRMALRDAIAAGAINPHGWTSPKANKPSDPMEKVESMSERKDIVKLVNAFMALSDAGKRAFKASTSGTK